MSHLIAMCDTTQFRHFSGRIMNIKSKHVILFGFKESSNLGMKGSVCFSPSREFLTSNYVAMSPLFFL